MIYTGKYENCKSGNLISISGDRGKKVNFEGKAYPLLAPKLSFWKTWKENIGKIDKYENDKFYIKEYYKQVLINIDIEEILKYADENIIFLCYEDSEEFCHRHIFAEYIELKYGIKVPEIEIDENGNITIKERPKYIRDILIEVIKEAGIEELQQHVCCNCMYNISSELVEDIIEENYEYRQMRHDDAVRAIGNCELHALEYAMKNKYHCEDYYPNIECFDNCKILKKQM